MKKTFSSLLIVAVALSFSLAGAAGLEYGSAAFGLKDKKPVGFVCHDQKSEKDAVACSRKGLKALGGKETKFFSWNCKGWIAGAASGKKVAAAWCKGTKEEAEQTAMKDCGKTCELVLSESDRK